MTARRVAADPAALAFLACAVCWIVAGLALPGFAAPGHLRYLLELSAMLGIVAAGQTLVIVSAGIDLSVGALITFAAIIGPLLSHVSGIGGVPAVLLILAITALVGVANGAGIVWLRVHPLVMTLATATILTGVLLLATQGTAVPVNNKVVVWLANGHVAGITASILVWVVVAAATILVLRRTVIGSWAYALGTNPRASMLSGVNEAATLLCVYGASGFTAGLTGVLLAGTTMQGYVGVGAPYLLTSIAAVVIGGTSILGGQGGYTGTIAGSILLTTVTSLVTVVNASSGWRNVFLGLLVLGLLALYARETAR
ncbi:MAG: ABC transporter permease [Acetobacteraceae bacterium]